jgi:hypothetical protein
MSDLPSWARRWSHVPGFPPDVRGAIDDDGVIHLSRPVDHVCHQAMLEGMALATAHSGLSYQLAPGSCEECG